MAIRRLWRTKASDCGVFKENKVASMPGESNTTRTTVYRIPWAIIRIPSDSLKEMADDMPELIKVFSKKKPFFAGEDFKLWFLLFVKSH